MLVRALAVAAPILEAGIGVGLLTRRYRTAAIYLAFVVHGFVLATIGPFGRNVNGIVWPWNIAMVLFLVILFRQTDHSFFQSFDFDRRVACSFVVSILFCLVPTMNYLNAWDDYLSVSLYSGLRNMASVYLSAPVAQQLPSEIQNYVIEGRDGNAELSIYDWSVNELAVPVYPEIRIFKNVTRAVCGYVKEPGAVRLVVETKPTPFQGSKRYLYDCSDLN
jgi:hypothetical protein